MAPATQKKKKVTVDTSNAKIDSYFKPASTPKQALLRKTFTNINENAECCHDENKASPVSSQSDSQGKGGKQQTTLSLSMSKQSKKLEENGGGAIKRQFGGEYGANRQFGENKRIKTPSTTITRKFGNDLTPRSRENDIPVVVEDIKSQRANENIGLPHPKHYSDTSRQPLQEKEIKTLHMKNPTITHSNSTDGRSVPAITNLSAELTFQVYCDDDDPDITKTLPTATNESSRGGWLEDLNTQFIPDREDDDDDEICNTQVTHFTVITSPVDLSYQHEFEDGDDDHDDDNDQLLIYRDDNEEVPVEEEAPLNVYRDDEREDSSSLFPVTESTNIKFEQQEEEEEDDDDALPPLFDEEDQEEQVLQRPKPLGQRQSFFFSHDENDQAAEEEDESNSTIDNFFNDDEDEQQQSQQQHQDPFIFDVEDDFSVGINKENGGSTGGPSMGEPESIEAVKEYHRPTIISRGRDLYDKFNMFKQEEEEEEGISSQQPTL